MDAQKVDTFIMTNGKYFPSEFIIPLREMLLNADDSKWALIQTIQYKDPTLALVISLVGGSLGIDRFFIGDMGLGIAKLITCGGFGIWSIIDWFFIMDAAREKNVSKLQMFLNCYMYVQTQFVHTFGNRLPGGVYVAFLFVGNKGYRPVGLLI